MGKQLMLTMSYTNAPIKVNPSASLRYAKVLYVLEYSFGPSFCGSFRPCASTSESSLTGSLSFAGRPGSLAMHLLKRTGCNRGRLIRPGEDCASARGVDRTKRCIDDMTEGGARRDKEAAVGAACRSLGKWCVRRAGLQLACGSWNC